MAQDRQLATMKSTQKSLEQRLAQAQTKIESLNEVKTQNDSLQTQTGRQTKQVESMKKEIVELNKTLEREVKRAEEAEKKAASG